jgi:hypothetical protein
VSVCLREREHPDLDHHLTAHLNGAAYFRAARRAFLSVSHAHKNNVMIYMYQQPERQKAAHHQITIAH